VLLELRVENYAVIDNIAVEFAPGLNLLTGETGAGKSILIDALALLLGDKASTDAIRHGADKAVVSAVFDADIPALQAVLENNGIDSDDEQLILRREIAAGGKGRKSRLGKDRRGCYPTPGEVYGEGTPRRTRRGARR